MGLGPMARADLVSTPCPDQGGSTMLAFDGFLRTSAGREPRTVRGRVQHAPGDASRRYGGWFRIDGVNLRHAMTAAECQLDIVDGPCLRIRIGEVDHGTAEFESVGVPLREPPAP
jgi:hypothetical protein